jgi:hypothetical protein
MRLLEVEGPARGGYFPEPAKSILNSDRALLAAAQEELSEFHFKRYAGYHYIGGFVGTEEARR